MHLNEMWWIFHVWFSLFVIIELVECKRNRNYAMPSTSCSTIPREIDGAVIRSSTTNYLYVNSACTMVFMADDDIDLFNRRKIRVHIEDLQISNCDVHLRFFDGKYTTSIPLKSYNCYSSSVNIAPFYTTSKYLTIRLDKRNNVGYKFRITLTSLEKRSYCKGRDVSCGLGYCADDDLRCDGIHHCPQSLDEKNCATYHSNTTGGFGVMAGLGMAALFVCVIAVIITVICCRRRHYTGRVLRTNNSTVTTSTTVVPPPQNQYPTQQNPYQQPGYGVPYPQQPPAYSYPQQPQPAMYPAPPGAGGYPQPSYPAAPPPAYPGYPQGGVDYNTQTEQVKVPH